MQIINVQIQLELEEGETRIDWIHEAIEECLVANEKIVDFKLVRTPA